MNRKYINLDADEGVFFSRELEAVKSQSYDILYPEFKARSLIPVSFDAGEGAETIMYEQYDIIGVAKIIANYADDLPRADVSGKEFRIPVKSLGASYGYNLQEVRAAKMAGKPLETRRANAAKRAMMQEENRIALLGDSEAGLLGLLNNPNVPIFLIAADGSGASKAFSSKDSDKIIRDLAAAAGQIMTVTNGVETADTILLPIAQFNLLNNTRMKDGSDVTIMKFFLGNNTWIKNVEWLGELKGIGVGGTDRMVVYKRSADKLTLEIPKDFEQLPVQERGLEFLVPCHQRIGGVIIYYPMSMVYVDGI